MTSLQTAAMETETALSARLAPDVLDASILLAEDQKVNADFITTILRDVGFRRIRVARDGREALRLITEAPPDILVLDVMMPILSGLAVCRTLREQPQFDDLPILVQTGLSSVHDRIEVFRAGATDVILKPINGLELVARVSLLIERKQLVRRLMQTRDRLQSDLLAAHDVQLSLLPQAEQLVALRAQRRLDLAARFEPSSELGGDFWGLMRLGPERVGLYVADFAGHGVEAALNTMRLHTIVQDIPEGIQSPADVLVHINARLKRLLPAGQFATMTCVFLEQRTATLSWASAGAPPPLLWSPHGGWQGLDSAGVPLGVASEAAYGARTTAFPEGAVIALCSDALSETRRPDGSRLEDAGVAALFAAADPLRPAAAILDSVLEGFHARIEPPVTDDLTVIVARSEPVHGRGPVRGRERPGRR